MVSTRNRLGKAEKEPFVQPAAQFVTDFTRLITDVDRLMLDIGNAVEKEREPGKPNGHGRKPTLNSTISSLQEHAQSFVKSLRHFEFLLDSVPVPFMELDGKARILRTNEECASMLNGSATPLPGKSLFNFVAGPDSKRLQESLTIARQTNKPCAVRLAILNQGKSYPVEMRMRRQFIGTETGYVAVFGSGADLRKTNGAAGVHHKDSALMNDLLVDLSRATSLTAIAEIVGNYCRKAFRSPAGMIFAERDGNLQMVSQWRVGEIPKQQLVEEMLKKGPVARAFRTGKPVVWRQHQTSHSNLSRFLDRLLRRCRCPSIAFLPIGAPQQPPAGAMVIVLRERDESAQTPYDDLFRLGQIVSGSMVRAGAYDEAIAARARAENALQSKDEFLSVLSHELKNPMVPILGWAVALSSGTLAEDKQNIALEGIVRNVRALNYMIEDLFDAARISSGKLRLQLSEIRIQDVAREALSAIQPALESKKLRISTDISEAIPPFMADSRRLHQVLMNLLNNAVKFTPAGGSIAVQIRRCGDRVEGIVSDTGKGMEREFLPFVFDRFRQENRHSKVHATGLGLGLAIVREIVELHGGSVKASSEGTDKGSTFVLRLPLRRRHGRSTPRTQAAAENDPAPGNKVSRRLE